MLTVFLFISGENIHGQCCSAGNPSGGDFLEGSMNRRELRLSLSLKHSYSDRYYYQDHQIEVPQVQFSRFNFMSFRSMYGITNRLNIFGELGYFLDKSQSVNIQGNHLLKATGMGDFTIGARYRITSSRLKTKELNISGGVRLPAGAFDKEMNGVVLPLSLQPSNGATKFTAGLYYFYQPRGSRLGFYMLSSTEISTTIRSDNFYYRYGNVYINALSSTYKLNGSISLILQSRLEVRDKDRREEEQLVPSTGSSVVFISPIARFNFLNDWEVLFQADVPVYKYVQGSQLTNKYAVSLGVSRRFPIQDKHKDKSIN